MKVKHKNMDRLQKALQERILILDGATGTELQKQSLTEEHFRGERFKDFPGNLKGNNDILALTFPEALKKVHNAYLEAGADIIETDSFNANAVSQSEYGLEDLVYEMCRAAAAVARECADSYSAKDPSKPRFVAGSMGPTSRSASMSPDVNDPSLRNVTFAELASTYKEAALGLIDGGADILLIETVFDTLNCKSAIYGIREALEERSLRMPVMISGTLSDASGRLLAGQNVESFVISTAHTPDLLSMGFNCALGASEMAPHIRELSSLTPVHISAHPNAGLPDELGRYTQTPEQMASILKGMAEEGLLNIAGGCCGTHPGHIKAIAEALKGIKPRVLPVVEKHFRLAGLDPLVVTKESNFINIGERTNVAGSRKFLKLIKENDFVQAMRIARNQIENGARIIDINMDDALLDSKEAMRRFLLYSGSEPEIARVPFMIDSSSFEVIEASLQCVQGKCVVNSISLKEGESAFLEKARKIRLYGAAVLIMAFDEQGQADTLERRVEVCRRSYKLLTEKLDFPPEDIIFDPNVFAVATGMKEHDSYAKDFIDAVKILKTEFPLCGVSGGISNVSFSFRGNNPVREALHSVFLYHAISNGMDFGIVNPAQLAIYEELPPDLRKAAQDVILNTDPGAPERLLEVSTSFGKETSVSSGTGSSPLWRKESLARRVEYAMLHGDDSFIAEDMEEALRQYADPVEIIEGPLMAAMKRVGVLFGEGKMFLPQVVKSARVMKGAVGILMPRIEEIRSGNGEKVSSNGTILFATVKGDVHDIGKNIASVVLQCNNYRILDLGVMVPPETILDTAEKEKVDMIALSGLITPSLEEMVRIAAEMEKRKMRIPLILGGATTSQIHTALKVAPAYPSGRVLQVHDASQGVLAVNAILNPKTKDAYWKEVKASYEKLRVESEIKRSNMELLDFAECCKNSRNVGAMECGDPGIFKGIADFPEIELEEAFARIDWSAFRQVWKDQENENSTLQSDAEELFREIRAKNAFRLDGSMGFFPAWSQAESIFCRLEDGSVKELPMFRQQFPLPEGQYNLSLADFFPPGENHSKTVYCGFFAVGCKTDPAFEESLKGDDYRTLLLKTLADRLAESCAVLLQEKAAGAWQGVKDPVMIRPAPGYPALPDHTLKRDIYEILGVEKKYAFALTEHYMMIPSAAVCGLLICHPEAKYFAVGRIGADQFRAYASRRNTFAPEELKNFIAWQERFPG